MAARKGILVSINRSTQRGKQYYDYVFSVTRRPRTLARNERFAFHKDLRWFFGGLDYEHLVEEFTKEDRKKPRKLPLTISYPGFQRVLPNSPRRTFGHAVVNLVPSEKLIHFRFFYPFDWIKEQHQAKFKRVGIAALLQLEMARHLASAHPGFRVRFSPSTSSEIVRQARALKVEHSMDYPIEEILAHLERVVPSKIKRRTT